MEVDQPRRNWKDHVKIDLKSRVELYRICSVYLAPNSGQGRGLS
jgi:hypothetical protein